MKIGILTFHCAINFGAVLQAYGLQEYLKSQGHEVYVLDYRPEYLLFPYKLFKWKWNPSFSLIDNLKAFVRDCMTFPIRRKRRIVFEKFLKSNISICQFHPCKDVSFDAYILGSDQIWNPQISRGFDDIYFGKFPAVTEQKVISYAASVGTIKNISDSLDIFFDKIKSCTALGAREQSLVDIINRYSNVPAVLTLDPVMLVGRDVFDKFVIPKEEHSPYLLCFQICYDKKVALIAERLAKEKGLRLIQVVSSSESIKNKNLRLTESPNNFVSLISGASYVVTSSFHGTVFSIIYRKNFNIVNIDSALSERMTNLLSSIGLENRLVFDLSNIISSPVEYGPVNEKIRNLRTISQNFLNDALS